MKSIIFLLLVACCLFPFSSTTFTSENPIILPTTTHDNNNNVVLDADGDPLKTGVKYSIEDPTRTKAIYLANIRGTTCPNDVLQDTLANQHLGNGMPVKFVLDTNDDVVRENVSINIMFSIETLRRCDSEVVWTVGEKRFVLTGGTLGNKRNIFKILEYKEKIPGSKNQYKLMYCPPKYRCEDVCTTVDNGKTRLAIFPIGAPPFIFVKVKNA